MRFRRKTVISNADPKRTLLKLVDPTHLSPGFAEKLQHYRMMGTVAKINLALVALPNFTALKNGDAAALSGRIQISPGIDYLERAFDESKYGDFSKQPYLEVTIPSLTDPTLGPEGQACDVHLHAIRALQVEGAIGTRSAARWATRWSKTLAQYAPNLPGLMLDGQIITPERSGRNLRSHRAVTSSMANWRLTSSSPCVRCSTGLVIERRSRTCIYAVAGRIQELD